MAKVERLGPSRLQWTVPLRDGNHTIVFEHGTTSGRRVIHVDGKEIFRKNWMFKLVGAEEFTFGRGSDQHTGVLSIRTQGLRYEYALHIDGKAAGDFADTVANSTILWRAIVAGEEHSISLDVELMEVYVDGERVATEGGFADDGTETNFAIGATEAYILTTNQTSAKGISHHLFVDEEEVAPESGNRTGNDSASQVGWRGGKV